MKVPELINLVEETGISPYLIMAFASPIEPEKFFIFVDASADEVLVDKVRTSIDGLIGDQPIEDPFNGMTYTYWDIVRLKPLLVMGDTDDEGRPSSMQVFFLDEEKNRLVAIQTDVNLRKDGALSNRFGLSPGDRFIGMEGLWDVDLACLLGDSRSYVALKVFEDLGKPVFGGHVINNMLDYHLVVDETSLQSFPLLLLKGGPEKCVKLMKVEQVIDESIAFEEVDGVDVQLLRQACLMKAVDGDETGVVIRQVPFVDGEVHFGRVAFLVKKRTLSNEMERWR